MDAQWKKKTGGNASQTNDNCVQEHFFIHLLDTSHIHCTKTRMKFINIDGIFYQKVT